MASSNVSSYPSLHAYFLRASVNKKLFEQSIAEQNPNSFDTWTVEAWTHLLLWYACLWVVVEGWRSERINQPSVTELLKDGKKAELLNRCRNAVFHYDARYVDPRIEEFIREPGIVEWVHKLHQTIGDFFLKP